MTEKKKTAEKKETVMPEPTGKDMINGIVQCMNQINMLANYINDYIEFQDSTEKFKGFIIEKYKKKEKTNDKADGSNSKGDREDKSGNYAPDSESK